MTVQEFIAANNLHFSSERTWRNPNMEDSADMDHWKVTILCANTEQQMELVFSMGKGHEGRKPELEDVLDCLASDAAGVENARSFEEWCSEYGYDEDSRKAERTYNACSEQSQELQRILGDEAYNELLWECERL